ncbi:MAG: protein-arginine deiminase family protein, partial [Candidatus Kapaibacterium sp.]
NPVESPNNNADQWMQDCMEIGYSRLPGQAFIHSVLKMPPDKGLHVYPPTLLGPAVGYHTVGQGNSQSRFDAGGNLEATPPVKEPDGTFLNGKEFPFGRIYYCSGRSTAGTAGAAFRLTMDADLEEFLKAQVVQSPIDLDSSWLTVGHVDELISFVPAADANPFKRYALLIASPRRAMQILRNLDQNGHHNDIILNGRTNGPLTVHDFLNNGIQYVATRQQLAQATTFCQTKLDAMLRELRKKIDIPRVIEVPVIFVENRHLPGLYEALTGDMVNMLVVGTTCIVPVANGPGPTAVHAQTGGNYNMDQFEAYLQQQLAAINITVEFIDGWDYYHVSHGEVHCGTNVRRTPHAAPNWWEFTP